MKSLVLSVPAAVALLFFAAPGSAKGSPRYTYEDGVLQGFHREPSDNSCVEPSSASGPHRVAMDGNARGNVTVNVPGGGPSSCDGEYDIVYTVTSGGATYVLTPRGDVDESKCGLLTRDGIRHNVLDHQPPRTSIKLRSDGKHFFVKMGSRESEYSVARVE